MKRRNQRNKITQKHKMNMIPFGEVVQERVEEAVKYGLIEQVAGIWRITAKAKKHYDTLSYMKYLQGKITTQEVKKNKPGEKKDPQIKERNFTQQPIWYPRNPKEPTPREKQIQELLQM
jgi:hypothetical protein